MMKFVKKRTTTQPEISRPSNLVVSKHKLVRTDGDFILIMEGDKVVGLVDKNDLDQGTFSQVFPPPSITPPAANSYLTPSSSRSTAAISSALPDHDAPALPSPVGTSPSSYAKRATGFSAKQHAAPMLPGMHYHSQTSLTANEQDVGYLRSTSVEQLFSPPIPPPARNRSESVLQQQGSHKYDTISYLPPSTSAQCNVEIRLGADSAERCPPPPNRAPPVPLVMSPVVCQVVHPPVLDFTEVLSVSVSDPELEAMTMEDLRKHAEDFENFIEEQVMQKWSEQKAHTERQIERIARQVAKDETMNTIRENLGRKKRPSMTDLFQSPSFSSLQDPLDPEPNDGYERLYVTRKDTESRESTYSPKISRQSTQESDGGDIEDMRF